MPDEGDLSGARRPKSIGREHGIDVLQPGRRQRKERSRILHDGAQLLALRALDAEGDERHKSEKPSGECHCLCSRRECWRHRATTRSILPGNFASVRAMRECVVLLQAYQP